MTLDLNRSPSKKAKKISSFKKTAYSFELSKRGDYSNLNYNPVFRASAIFFAMKKNNFDTKVSFLNYWELKNNNANVNFLYTLRDEHGEKLYKSFQGIDKTTFTISVSEILEQLEYKKDFCGTIEFEFYSSEDLKYSFPATQVFYETEDGVSCVHTNQRIFNNIEDSIKNQSLNSLQTGFDVHFDSTKFSFLTFINGPVELEKKSLEIYFYNHKGEELKKEIFYEKINSYQTIFIDLKRFDDLEDFLGGGKGFCKVLSPTEQIFNRILTGTFSNDLKKSSVTHSYYDCSEVLDYIEEDVINENEYKCYLPFNMIDGIDLDFIFYPIFSKSSIKISLEEFDKSSGERIPTDDILHLKKGFKNPITLKINKFIKGTPTSDNIYCLSLKSDEKKLPSRFTFGMNYNMGSLGSNISSSMLMNLGENSKKRGYFWGPALFGNNFKSYIALSHFSRDKLNKDSDAVFFKLFDENGLIFEKEYMSTNPSALNISVDNVLRGVKYKNLNKKDKYKILWFTLESNNSNFICNHIHVSNSNLVTADHSF